jgi:hypothetical protein
MARLGRFDGIHGERTKGVGHVAVLVEVDFGSPAPLQCRGGNRVRWCHLLFACCPEIRRHR